MSGAGYGRGYYGAKQLAKEPRRGGISGWIKLAVVVGAGGVIWYLWPRKDPPLPVGLGPGYDDSLPAPQPPSGILRLQIEQQPQPQQQPQLAQPTQFAQPSQFTQPQLAPSQLAQPQLAQPAQYATAKAYEDAVVASAKQLQDAGTKVVLPPHLAHLASRLLP